MPFQVIMLDLSSFQNHIINRVKASISGFYCGLKKKVEFLPVVVNHKISIEILKLDWETGFHRV